MQRNASWIVLLHCAAGLLFAQNVPSFLKGVLLDPSGGAVPGADCVLTNRQIGRVITAVSWTDGSFHFPNIAAGDYDLKVRGRGFKVLLVRVHLRVSETVDLNLTLEVGDVTEAIEVRPEPYFIDTASSTHSLVIDPRRVLDLPVSGGNPVELAFLAPGIATMFKMIPIKPPFNNTPFSADGSPVFTNEFQLDGVSNTFADGAGHARDAFRPPAAAIREFKVQTTPYDASVGGSMGGVVSVVTASGTNELHGEAHYWAKNSAFDAPNFFNNKYRTRVLPYADHRYGASGGGPMRIPGVYDGANRTFWYYAWEGNKWGMPQNFTGTVPTAAERAGDFSELLRIGSSYQIYDPFTAAAAPGGRVNRLPLPGNVVPAGRLDAVGVKLAGLYPVPNQTGLAGGINNFFHSGKAKEDYYVHFARVDHAFTGKNRAFLRLDYDHWVEDKNDYYGDRRNGIVLMRINRGLCLNDTYVVSARTVLDVRYGITAQEFPEHRISRGYDLATLGFSPQLTHLVDSRLATIPRFSAGVFSSYSSWESGDGANSAVTHAAAFTLSRLDGPHILNLGADIRLYRAFGGRYPYSVAPDFSFSSTYTRGPMDNSPPAPVGQELAAMLFGIPSGSMMHNSSSALQNVFAGLFMQDEWKVTPNLVIDAGVRYEVESPITERFDRLSAGFDSGAENPIGYQARFNYAALPIPGVPLETFRVLGGPTFLHQGPFDRSPFRTGRGNLMPRVGLAWRLTPETVLRGGYGIYFNSLGVNAEVALQSGFSQATPMQPSLDNGLTFVATNANPFPHGLAEPLGPQGGLRTNLGQSFQFYNRDLKRPYSQRWSFGFQRVLPAAWLLDASYVGNRAVRLRTTRSLNETPARYLSSLPVRDQATIDYLSASFPSPFHGIDPIYEATITRAAMLRPYPQFGSITTQESNGYSWYHALETRLEKKFSQGYTFQLSYTWSKLMTAVEYLNPTDPAPYRVIGSYDRPHRLAASGIWVLPFGRGGRIPPALTALISGWQLGGVVSIQSGPPVDFDNVIFNGDIKNIPLPSNLRSADRWLNTDAGFDRDPNQQLDWNVRTFPLRFSGIREDGVSRWDFSLIRNLAPREKWTLQLRAEVFNAWNHSNFAGPNAVPTTADFGTVVSTVTDSRQWQFSARLKF